PGDAPPIVTLGRPARVVLITTAASIASYPVLAALGFKPWVVAAPAAGISVIAAWTGGASLARVARGVSWELVPFLYAILVLATVLARAGVTDQLAHLYRASPAPLPTIGVVGAAGSALINNHPMALIHSIVLEGAPHRYVFAALVGGDLGPRLLPI